MKRALGSAGLATMALLLMTCKKVPSTPRSSSEYRSPTVDEEVETGRVLYERYCALCHGPAGVGYAADDANQLRNSTFLATATTPFLWLAIERGRPGTPMAGFGDVVGGPLDGEAIQQLIAYLRSLEQVEPVDVEATVVDGDAARGEPIYAKRCASCHGDRGQGGTATSLSNPYFLATASDGFIRYAIEHGRPGTAMPAFADALSSTEMNDLTSYIRSWARTVEAGAPAAELPPPRMKLVINPEGPAPQFGPRRQGRYLPGREVAAALERGARLVILDARPTSDWLKSHIPGAIPVPYYDGIGAIRDDLPRDGTWIISYCACPHAASGKVMDELRSAGFRNTAVLDEGILEWAARGYPVAVGRARARD